MNKQFQKTENVARARRSAWSVAFASACAAMIAIPAVSSAQSSEDINSQLQQLKEQVRRLQHEVDQNNEANHRAMPPKQDTPAITSEKSAQSATTSGEGTAVTVKGATLNLGGLRLTPGGFFAAEAIYRTHNEIADLPSNFSSYYYRSSPNYYSGEFRPSARQSRVQLLAQGPEDAVNKVEGFIASDFLSSGTSSNSKESNSYTLRLREAYLDYSRKDLGFYILGGQTWSMATMYKSGLTPRTENIPVGIEPQYVVGFQWARQAQLRFVQSFGKFASVGLSLEEPQAVIAGTAPAGAVGPATGNNVLNNTTTYSDDIAPDVIYKAAFDPGFGHYEIYGMTRFLHDRSENTPGVLNSTENHTSTAQSFGGGLILPVLPKLLEVQVSGLVGHGIGRYGSGQLADASYSTNNGSYSPLMSEQGLVGLVAHPLSRLDIYTYGGIEHNGSVTGFGRGTGSDATCNQNPVTFAAGVTASCTTASTVREITGGFWYKFYKGPIGYVTTGAQVEYNTQATYSDTLGRQGKTSDTSVLFSLRYYPYQ